jgi:hypothetical protein
MEWNGNDSTVMSMIQYFVPRLYYLCLFHPLFFSFFKPIFLPLFFTPFDPFTTISYDLYLFSLTHSPMTWTAIVHYSPLFHFFSFPLTHQDYQTIIHIEVDLALNFTQATTPFPL